MRRLARGLTVTAVVLAVPAVPTTGEAGPAAASDVVSETAAGLPTPQAASEYWTPARMATAQPLEVVLDGGDAPTPQAGPDTIATLVARPYTAGGKRQNGTVFFKIPGGGEARCSGTAIQSANESVVWTAGHCVYHTPQDKFMRNWVFVPGYGSSGADPTPFGKWKAEKLGVPSRYANNGNPRFDVGAASVVHKGGDSLGERVGGQQIAFNYPTDPAPLVTAFGYPSVGPFKGNRQYRCKADLKSGDNQLPPGPGPDPVHIKCDMSAGSSGGGWRVNQVSQVGQVISVVSYGWSNKPNQRFGPYQGDKAQELFECAEQGFPFC